MFPLGAVLLPGAALPLHVFEPRYQALVRDCLAGTPEFGVALIERGSEVGGGDTRVDVACVARIVELASFDDGRYALGTVGVRRVRVRRWLPDAPYPRAEVVDWPDEAAGPAAAEHAAATTSRLRRVLALASELGLTAGPATFEVDEDPTDASNQLAGLAPVGPLDKLALLTAEGAGPRLDRLDAMLDELESVLARRLQGG
jgi:uncharacterized protein